MSAPWRSAIGWRRSNPFPAAFDDALAAWRFLRAQGVAARHIAVGGDSAGGAVRFAAAAGTHDVAVTLEIWPNMIHAWPLWNAQLEPGRRALAAAGAFLRRHL